ncbi:MULTISPECIES: hypothetical protein [unclassified Methanoculleus]|nr:MULTISPECIES: hypothetical protein [unclassified Methanoculleus]MCK9319294.1 hypothetical protein [Methanoculleus sp.]MDD2255077.1 hypothetical protein [Methanoculleus sp.]MDD2788081.1 hypothetical protein [Methanoculleus sp.]MDD3217461.1 hypothetical protein [Methanoculleus sp.]MDD4315429.1 hypothetical protein [Methanoculleus sp.]
MTAPRDTLDYLDDILDAVEKIEIFTRGMRSSTGMIRPSTRSREHWK